MEISTGLIALGRAVVGAVVPPIKKKYFDQPKVYITLEFLRGGKLNDRLSPNNHYDGVNPIPMQEALYYFRMDWRYSLSLRNNSDYSAYNIRLLDPAVTNQFKVKPAVDSLKPLQPNSEVTYEIIYEALHESTGAKSVSYYDGLIKRKPKFIVEYTNVSGTKFYTVCDFSQPLESRFEFLRKLPRSLSVKL